MHRAYSLIKIKSIDEDDRVITGMATTPETDRVGDIVEPKGGVFKLPIPLLWQHDSRKPVGKVFYAKVTDEGIEIKARFAKINEPGTLKDRLDEAWQSVKLELVRGLSIGFASLEEARIKDSYGYRYIKWLWLELSAVTIPANGGASILTAKALDLKALDLGLAALGTGSEDEDDDKPPSGVSDTKRVVQLHSTRPGRTTMKKTYTEQITQWEATRAAKSARMDELMETAGEKGLTLDKEAQDEHDGLDTEVKDIDAHLVRLRESEKRAKATAKPVDGDNPVDASKSRAGLSVISVKDNVQPGIRFARLAMLIGLAKGSRVEALSLAQDAYPGDTRLQEVIKTAVAAGTTANAQAPLLQYTDYFQDFVEYLRPATIIGKFGRDGVPALRPVPFNVRIATQTAGGSGYWVGQGKPTPLTKGTFATTTMDFTKVGAISVLTKEEVRFANPAAEAKVRDDLRDSLVARIDQDFIDPANSGTANVKPASITNGVAATAVTGTTAAYFRADFKTMMGGFIAANITPSSGVLIMSTTMALAISMQMNALGQSEFPDLSMTGGKLLGLPVIVSEYMTALGSPGTQMIVLVNANDVYLADDGAVTVEASDQASLEMSDAPAQDATTGGGASMVSLWQTGTLGLKAERFINWKLRRAAAVAYLSGAAYA